ncbi:MAG: hypothetical protein KTR14_07290 [Vampirovibrio sp.]|nr:hypothetical protein [Vampirovibrio sp.]
MSLTFAMTERLIPKLPAGFGKVLKNAVVRYDHPKQKIPRLNKNFAKDIRKLGRLDWSQTIERLKYLVVSAIILRMVVAAQRIYMNRPDSPVNQHSSLSEEDRQVRFYERCFVEGLGTLANVVSLHFGMDMVASAINKYKSEYLAMPKSVLQHIENSSLTKGEKNAFRQSLFTVFGTRDQMKHRLSKVIFERAGFTRLKGDLFNRLQVQNADLNVFDRDTGQVLVEKGNYTNPYFDLYRTIKVELRNYGFTKRSSRAAWVAFIGGAVSTALIGGSLIQYLNDRIVSPILKQKIGHKFGESAPAELQIEGSEHPIPIQSTNPESVVSGAPTTVEHNPLLPWSNFTGNPAVQTFIPARNTGTVISRKNALLNINQSVVPGSPQPSSQSSANQNTPRYEWGNYTPWGLTPGGPL